MRTIQYSPAKGPGWILIVDEANDQCRVAVGYSAGDWSPNYQSTIGQLVDLWLSHPEKCVTDITYTRLPEGL